MFAILLLQYFYSAKKGIKLIAIFAILIAFFALGLNHLFNSCFGASTPIDLITKNITDQNLKIYAITFWDNSWSGNGNFVNYDTELKPNKSSEFCIDNDNGKFWLVAKNNNNEIKYLQEITDNKSKYIFKIDLSNEIEVEKAQIAKELTFKKDKTVELEKYLILTNIILIGLLIFKIMKK
jgi:hypothetical protein